MRPGIPLVVWAWRDEMVLLVKEPIKSLVSLCASPIGVMSLTLSPTKKDLLLFRSYVNTLVLVYTIS
jgi:hypothetical protein